MWPSHMRGARRRVPKQSNRSASGGLRWRPADLRTIDAAADIAALTRSELIRLGALTLAKQVLSNVASAPVANASGLVHAPAIVPGIVADIMNRRS